MVIDSQNANAPALGPSTAFLRWRDSFSELAVNSIVYKRVNETSLMTRWLFSVQVAKG